MLAKDGDSPRVRTTFLSGGPGAYAVAALATAFQGHKKEAKRCAQAVLAYAPWVLDRPRDQCELLYGRAGFLQAVLFLRRSTRAARLTPRAPPSSKTFGSS